MAFHFLSLHEALMAGNRITIGGLGDSLTYGWEVRTGFFDRFIDKLKGKFSPDRIVGINSGVPGNTARQGVARLSAVMQHSPQLVVVQFGLNDMYQDVKVEDFMAALAMIVKGVKKGDALPLLVTSTPLFWPEGARLSSVFYDGIQRVAAECNVPCARLDQYWQEQQNISEEHPKWVYPDGVHPTDEGHEVMAEGLFEFMIQEGSA